MAISSDGSHMYFIARGKLATNTGVQGTTTQEGQANLYVHAQGAPLRFIATLPASDEEQFEQQDFKEWSRRRRSCECDAGWAVFEVFSVMVH